MSSRRVGRFAVVLTATAICVACGQIYRPVVLPTVTTPPNPANFHAVFALNANVNANPGTAVQIDVSGDTVIGQTPADPNSPNVGINPTHAAILSNNSRVFVASAGSMLPGGADAVASFTPAFNSTVATGLGNVFTFTLPAGSLPVFANSTQSTAMYVADYGTNSVSVLNTSSNTVTNNVPVGTNPVALAETPNGQKLYVANQGSNSVSSLNTVDLSLNTISGFSTPVWVIARNDNHRIYVLDQGDGQLVTIDVATDIVVPGSISVGAGANFVAYDPHLNRIYVTNPTNGSVYVISTMGGAGDTPQLLKQITIPGLSSTTTPACSTCLAPVPSQVAALRDGSRFYVASYQTATACPDPNVAGACVIPQLTVFDANSLNVKTTLFLLGSPQFSPAVSGNPQPYAVPPISSCVPPVFPATYAPGLTRFRMTTAAAADSSRVYVGMCDAGAVAVVNTTTSTLGTGPTNTPDTLVTDLLAPFSAGAPQSNGQPPPQHPIFLLTGQ
jgi:YVTN family beta-propeller protein